MTGLASSLQKILKSLLSFPQIQRSFPSSPLYMFFPLLLTSPTRLSPTHAHVLISFFLAIFIL